MELNQVAPSESKTTETIVQPQAEVKETKKEETLGDLISEKPKDSKMVPEAVLIEQKKAFKEVQRELKDLKESIQSGQLSNKEESKSVKALQEEFPDASEFIGRFYSAVKAEVKSEAEESIRPFKEKETAKERDKVFNEHYEKALADMPEFKDVANKEVIKSLALDPKNSNKTFRQILELVYGETLPGKRVLEQTTPGGGKEDAEVDFNKAANDTNYFKEIMANPRLKQKYNESLGSRLKL